MKPKKLISKLGAVVLSMLMILTNVDFAVFARTAHVTLGEHLGYSYDVEVRTDTVNGMQTTITFM